MICSVKESKVDKINETFFRIISVSQEQIGDYFNLSELLPDPELWLKYTSGELSKKKFLKKYEKYISQKDTNVEYSIFTIAMALKQKANICITANEKEYRSGYVKVLVKYISDKFGVEIVDLEEANSTIKDELSSYDKKERKLLKKDEEDLSKKQKKFRGKLIKGINKSLSDGLSDEGKEAYDKMDHKFALDQLAMVYIKEKVVDIDKKNNCFKNIKVDDSMNVKPLISGMIVASDASKPIKKIIKSVFESHDCKFSEKKMKKMDKTSLFAIFGEIYGKILILRSGLTEE